MTQFIILGMHRSGTSSVTKLVNMMGAYAGERNDLVVANEENPKGFFERYDVIDINNRILNTHNSHWFHLNSFNISQTDDNLDTEIAALIAKLNQHEHWVIKDPRLCNTLEAWLPHLDNPFLIMVHRDPIEIALSLNKRNGFSIEHGLSLWEYAAIGMLNAAKNLPYHILSYANLMRDPITTTKALYEAISKETHGLTCPPDDGITDFIDPSLYRSKANNPPVQLNEKQLALVAMFEDETTPDSLSLSDESIKTMKQAAAYVPILAEREAIKEKLGHTEVTVKEQRVRIEGLIKERDALKPYKVENTKLKTYASELEALNHELGLDKAERDLIKKTRWWKLRSWLLREDGMSLKELINRPK